MPDKDDFTFDDSDDFPETDLSSAFSDGEHAVPDAEPEEEELQGATGPTGGGGSRSRILLVLALLVVAIGAGAYYFMDLGGTTPTVPNVPAPAAKAVALPPQPAAAPQAEAPAPPAVAVAVPVPPPVEPAGQPAADPAQEAVAVTAAPAAPAAAPEQPVAPAQPEKAAAAPAEAQGTIVSTPAPVTPAPAEEKPLQGAMAGTYTLDAGSYLMEGNRDALVKKLRKLGYEPLVTPIKATIDMTRLSLGTFPANEVEEALAFAKTIESSAFSVPAGDQFVIYAGTFLKSSNIDALKARFLKEGIRAKAEPVEVERTLSRIRFGSFASKTEAEDAAREVAGSGVKAVAVKNR